MAVDVLPYVHERDFKARRELARCLSAPEAPQPHDGQALEALASGIDLYAGGFQRGDAKERFRAFIAEGDHAAGEFAHDLEFTYRNVQRYFAPVGGHVHALPGRSQPDGFEVGPRDEGVHGASIH